jgi:hypothetical protein
VGSELTIDTAAKLGVMNAVMPRPLRIQYAGARYHVMSRGDRREAIFYDHADRVEFLRTLGQACLKTGWQVHARGIRLADGTTPRGYMRQDFEDAWRRYCPPKTA